MQQTAVLTLQGVAKFYGDKLIFRNLNFSAMPGRLYLILGSNGSGKSTLLRIMAGLAKPEAGLVNKAAGLRISYLGHATFLYNHLTAMHILTWKI